MATAYPTPQTKSATLVNEKFVLQLATDSARGITLEINEKQNDV